MQLELQVYAVADEVDRAAICLVCDIANELVIGGHGQSARHGNGVLGLDHLFARIARQRALPVRDLGRGPRNTGGGGGHP